MQLKKDWKIVIKKAWSVRLVALSAIFSAAQLAIPIYADTLDRDTFALLSILACIGAIFVRVLTQGNMPDA